MSKVMSSVGRGPSGKIYTGRGTLTPPSFQDIGTNSGLTQYGVLLGGGSGPFTVTNAGTAGYVLTSAGASAPPTYLPISSSGAVTTLTGNTGGALSPTAGNFNIVGTGSTTVAGSGSTLTMQMTGLTNHAVLVGAGTATITNVGPTATAGQVLQSAGASADPTFSTPTYPSASGTARKIIVSDGTNNVYSTETWAVPGTSGNILTSDGTNWTSAALPALPTLSSALGTIVFVDDFLIGATGSGILSSIGGWVSTSFSNNATASTNLHPGVVGNTAFSSSTARLQSGTTGIYLGNGIVQANFIVNVETLSTGTNTYTLQVGLAGSFNSTTPTNGIWFQYTNAVNSGNWQLKTSQASAVNTENTSVPVTTGWHNLQIVVNAVASSVTFSIDGVAQTAVVASIPLTTVSLSVGVNMIWSAGTIAVGTIALDLVYINYTLTTPRT